MVPCSSSKKSEEFFSHGFYPIDPDVPLKVVNVNFCCLKSAALSTKQTSARKLKQLLIEVIFESILFSYPYNIPVAELDRFNDPVKTIRSRWF